MTAHRFFFWALLGAILIATPACSTFGNEDNSAESDVRSSGGLRLPGMGRIGGSTEVAGIGVNSFLWRASLDTISFMPLQEVDPFGGVIITDWYANPQLPTERFKVTVYILDTRLRADALSVRVFRQVQGDAGQWADATVTAETAIEIENAILTRARQLRISTLEQ